MNRPLLLATAAALSLAACNQPAGNTAAPDASSTATAPAPSASAAVQDYAAKAAASDMLEIQTSEAALKRSSNADVKAFAQMMVQDHTKSSNDLKAALSGAGLNVTLPTALPADMQQKVEDLNEVDAGAFDKSYMDLQVDAHQTALDLHRGYANGGDNAQLKALAATIAAKVQEHHTQATTLRDNLK